MKMGSQNHGRKCLMTFKLAQNSYFNAILHGEIGFSLADFARGTLCPSPTAPSKPMVNRVKCFQLLHMQLQNHGN